MVGRKNAVERLWDVLIYGILILIALSCILPILNVLAMSLSSRDAALSGRVGLWPVGFNIYSYKYLIDRPQFTNGLWVSVKRLVIGVPYNMFLILITAYPLSKRNDQLRGRMVYVWFFVFTMLFGGGLIPTYMTVRTLGLLNKIWVLIIPGGVMVWNIILMMNFFRSVPPALEESAFVDGAGYMTSLFRIYIPLSLPAMATIGLFVGVAHWNAWFDGLIYMSNPENYPLQTYIYTLITSASRILEDSASNDPELMLYIQTITDKTIKSSQIFLAALPILLAYPFLQRYFMTGIKLGSVKE